MKLRGAVVRFGVLFVALAALAVGATAAVAAVSDTEGKTTLEQRVVPATSGAYDFLKLGPGEPYTVRQELATAQAGRDARRTSLVYFGQLSDFQLADEESPARLEVIDPLSTPLNLPFGAAWRPWEALEPQIDEAMIRQVNKFAGASPVADGSGARRAMDFSIDTGDSADSQQLNETLWVRILLEGGNLNPNSGVDKTKYSNPLCPNLFVPGAAEAARYTGVQDYNDYAEGTDPDFYDPNDPRGAFAAWPRYPGLMDRAEQGFQAVVVRSTVVLANFFDYVGEIAAVLTQLEPLVDQLQRGADFLRREVARTLQDSEDAAAIGRHHRPDDLLHRPYMWIERPSTPSAASFTASLSVGCECTVMPMSSDEPRYSNASTASSISSDTFGPIM